jgi:hypothetical protein
LPTNYRPSIRLARLAVVLGAIEFILRALLRTKSDWLSDLAAPYTSTKLWLAGANPYDPFKFLATWYANGGPNLGLSDFVSGSHSVYPPPTLLFMLPLAQLRWPTAVLLFVLIALLLYATVIYSMVRLGWPEHRHLADIANEPLALLFIAFALGLAPIHTAFHSLNIVLFAACAAMLAVLVLVRSVGSSGIAVKAGHAVSTQSVLAGAGVTIAILLKPTTGVFLLPWLVRERRWRLILAVLLACAVITAISLGPLIAHQGMTWLTDYRQNVSFLFTHGGNADVSPENAENTDRIDLQLIAYALFRDRTLASAAAAIVYLVLLAVFLGCAGWSKPDDSYPAARSGRDLPLLVAAGCLALGLLPSYTRVYAAVVVLPLVLWCFTHLQFSSARWLLLLLSDFLLNTSALVRKAGEKLGLIAHAPRLWDFTIGGHTCWLLLAIGIMLPLAVRQQTRAAKELAATALSTP